MIGFKKQMEKTMITWQQLTINSNQDNSEQITIWLNLLDAKSIETHPDGYQNGYIVKALFLPNIPIEQVKNFLQKNIEASLVFCTELIQDNDWQETQNLNLAPIEINKKLAIYPDNYTGEITHSTPIYIQAIDAFGTGKHPTTFQCLEWLCQQDLQNKQIIDFGCGSGILAIAALALGAKHVWAIDIDPKALEATKKNAKLNRINSNQLTIDTRVINDASNTKLNIKADLIIANIFANPLCELASHFKDHLKLNGKIVLAGMLAEQSPQVLASYKQYFSINEINELEGWPLLLAKKEP